MSQYVLDASQYKAFTACQLMWYERYVNGMTPRREGQADGPLATGSLFHDAMEQWLRGNACRPTPECVVELDPSRECLDGAYLLMDSYTRAYPRGSDPWKLVLCEEPVFAPLTPLTRLVAKVDGIVSVDTPTRIPAGQGETLLLYPGSYVLEHKTNSRRRETFDAHWRTAVQASFQMLACQATPAYADVRGIIVNCVTKPNTKPPQRKCQQCEAYYDLASWRPVAPPLFACPMCGAKRKIAEAKVEPPKDASCHRLLVERTAEQLEAHRQTIVAAAKQMEALRTDAMTPTAAWELCGDYFHRDCDFARVHSHGRMAGDQPAHFEQLEDPLYYIGL